MLTIVGDAFIDIIVPMEDVVPNGACSKNIKIAYGGTANVAVWASRLGEKVRFFGKVGNDALGVAFKDDLIKERVEDLTIIDSRHPTGICVSLIGKDGERTMITNRGANDNIKIQDAKAYTQKIIDSEIIFFTGYSLISDKTSKAVLHLMKKTKEKKKSICFNPGALNIIDDAYKEIVREYCDIIILNLEEGKAITGETNPNDILKKLRTVVENIVLTMGTEGSMTCQDRRIVKLPAKKVKVIDTTGAGDAFSAGFLVGILRGLSMEECSKTGHNVAAEVIQRFGAR